MTRTRETDLPEITGRDRDREREFPAMFVMVASDTREMPLADFLGDTVLVRSPRLVLILRYGRNGGCTAYNYYTGQKIGRAGGGGWDITAGALIDAAVRWYGVPRTDGARGREHVREHLAAHGVTLYDMGSAAHALPAEVTR